MESFDGVIYEEYNNVHQHHLHQLTGDGGMQYYGFDSQPMEGFSRSPTHTMQSSDAFDYSQFESVGGGVGTGDIGADDNEGIFTSSNSGGGPLLPDPSEMREEGTGFREWRRQNLQYLEEKEKKEKELRNQIINEADEYKRQFYEKRKQTCETTKTHNRAMEKLYLTQQEKFHKEAHLQYWKAIAELIPHEVPNIEKRRKKKEEEKNPSVVIIQGPKPGKPTDMSRMRQILLKLKQNPPPHMLPKNEDKDGKADSKEAQDDGESVTLAVGSQGGKATVSTTDDGTSTKGAAPDGSSATTTETQRNME